MTEQFAKLLISLNGCPIEGCDDISYYTDEHATVLIRFANDAKLRTDYWRLIKMGKHVLSSFDHQQQYSLPGPINAKTELRKELENQVVSDVKLDASTGDLLLDFGNCLTLQVLNFTGYEIWEMTSPDGITEYSNYNR